LLDRYSIIQNFIYQHDTLRNLTFVPEIFDSPLGKTKHNFSKIIKFYITCEEKIKLVVSA